MELPLFYKEKMKQILKDEYEDYIKSFESEAQSGIRINTLKISPAEFEKKGIFDLEPVKWCDEGFYCGDNQRPAKNYLYHAGLYYIQEPSAMLSLIHILRCLLRLLLKRNLIEYTWKRSSALEFR